MAALNAGRAERRRPGRERGPPRRTTPRRARRGLSVVGAAAAAVLCIGGFGAVVAGAGPGDALYGLRTMLFGAPKEVRDDQVALAARTEMNQVQDLISQGDWQQAQDKLVAVSTQVASIGDEQQKQELLDQFNDLSAKVVERDPAATAPPGIIYTVPPSAAELVPAVAPPTSTPSAPSAESTRRRLDLGVTATSHPGRRLRPRPAPTTAAPCDHHERRVRSAPTHLGRSVRRPAVDGARRRPRAPLRRAEPADDDADQCGPDDQLHRGAGGHHGGDHAGSRRRPRPPRPRPPAPVRRPRPRRRRPLPQRTVPSPQPPSAHRCRCRSRCVARTVVPTQRYRSVPPLGRSGRVSASRRSSPTSPRSARRRHTRGSSPT